MEAQPLRSVEPSRDGASVDEQELRVTEASPDKLPATEKDTKQDGSQDVEEVAE